MSIIFFYDSTIIAGKNIYICSPNKSIHDLLNAHYLQRCIVKAVAFTKLDDAPPKNMLERMLTSMQRNTFTKTIKLQVQMDFVRNKKYNSIGMFLKDVTIDYAGSFNKDEIINYLTARLPRTKHWWFR